MTNCFIYGNCNHKDCDKDFCMRKYKLETLYDSALVSPIQRKHITISLKDGDQDDERDKSSFLALNNISNDVLQFINNGANLYLHSRISGNGKTSWALRILESYFTKIWAKSDLTCRALFISVPRFLIELKDSIRNPDNAYIEHIRNNINTADIVIFDDIAAKSGTEYEINHLLSLIDTRINLGKSNIFTSNLNPEEMLQALGSRLASRICNMSADIELFGTDKRCWAAYQRMGA